MADEPGFADTLGRILQNLGLARLLTDGLLAAWVADEATRRALADLPLDRLAPVIRSLAIASGRFPDSRIADKMQRLAEELGRRAGALQGAYRVVPDAAGGWPSIHVGGERLGREELGEALTASRQLIEQLKALSPGS